MKSYGTRSIVLNGGETLSVGQQQTIQAVHLYGAATTDVGNADIGVADLYRIITTDTDATAPSDKSLFASAVMDLTITNVSEEVTLPDATVIKPPLEVDIYEVVFKKVPQNVNSAYSIFAEANTDTSAIPGFTNKLSILDRGATPFQFPQAIRVSGMKVLKKTKYFIPYGNSVTYQMRDARNRWFNTADVEQNNSFVAPSRATRSLLVIYKIVSGLTSADPEARPGRLAFGASRTYTYKILKDNQNYATTVL